VLDADIRGFFDNMSHAWAVKFLEHRVADPRILRLIQQRSSLLRPELRDLPQMLD